MKGLKKMLRVTPVSVLAMLLFTTVGIAAWTFSFTAQVSRVDVTSETDLEYISTLDTQVVDTSTASAQVVDTVQLISHNEVTPVQFTWTESIIDVSEDLCDNTGDITIVLDFSGVPITSGAIRNITTTELVSITYDILEAACPQSAEVVLTITKV